VRIMKYFLYLIILVNLTGCGGGLSKGNNNGISQDDSATKKSNKYDVYYCTAVNISTTNGNTEESAIYGAYRESLNNFTKIINISGTNKFMDSCTVDDFGNLYWTDRSANGIFKSDAEGKHIEQIVFGLDTPYGLAIDENNKRLYWSNWIHNNNPQSGEVGYCDLDGGNKKIIITEGLVSGGSLVVANDKLYISDFFGGQIMTTSLNGENLEKIADANQPSQIAFDYDNNKLIWSDIADDKISSIDLITLQTTDLIVFDDIFANPKALAIDKINNKILFINPVLNNGVGQNPSSQLHSADLDGNNINIFSNLPVSLYAVQALITID